MHPDACDTVNRKTSGRDMQESGGKLKKRGLGLLLSVLLQLHFAFFMLCSFNNKASKSAYDGKG
jgi:hypothetical protein